MPLSVVRVLSIAATGVSLVLTLVCQSAAASIPLTLTIAPAAPQYATSDEITPRVTLHLDSAATSSATVCTFAPGVLRFDTVTANGRRLTPQRVASFPGMPRTAAQASSLVTLQPGDSVEIPFPLVRHADRSVRLKDVRPTRTPGPDNVLLYTLTIPGTYSFRLTYRYRGPDGEHTDVLRHFITSNTFTIRLVP